MKLKREKFLIGGLLFLVLCISCATYQSRLLPARNLSLSGNYKDAARAIQTFAETENGDQLAYLLDYATLLYYAGEYKESIQAFLKADKLSEDSDYHSVSRQAGSLLMNEEMLQYKGNTFEKVFISAYLAMNYLELNQLDEALVEARRIHEKYLKLKSDEAKTFEINSFGKYLSSLLWEADKKYDLAYLSMKEAYELDSSIFHIEKDLLRLAQKAQRPDEVRKWSSEFNIKLSEVNPNLNSKNGTVIVFVHQGIGPEKQQDSRSAQYPRLVPTTYGQNQAMIRIGDLAQQSQLIYDVEAIAIRSLQDDYNYLMKKRISAYIAKEVMADQIRQKNEALGTLAWFFMHASERADLRQWSQLPKTIQVAKFSLPPGEYQIHVDGESVDLSTPALRSIVVKSGATVFRSLKIQ